MIYRCTVCQTGHDTFNLAYKCCKADFIECPLSEIPDYAELLSNNGNYTFGKNFNNTNGWFIGLCNNQPLTEPSRIYFLPPIVSKLIDNIYSIQYKKGKTDAQRIIQKALGL